MLVQQSEQRQCKKIMGNSLDSHNKNGCRVPERALVSRPQSGHPLPIVLFKTILTFQIMADPKSNDGEWPIAVSRVFRLWKRSNRVQILVRRPPALQRMRSTKLPNKTTKQSENGGSASADGWERRCCCCLCCSFLLPLIRLR